MLLRGVLLLNFQFDSTLSHSLITQIYYFHLLAVHLRYKMTASISNFIAIFDILQMYLNLVQ